MASISSRRMAMCSSVDTLYLWVADVLVRSSDGGVTWG